MFPVPGRFLFLALATVRATIAEDSWFLSEQEIRSVRGGFAYGENIQNKRKLSDNNSIEYLQDGENFMKRLYDTIEGLNKGQEGPIGGTGDEGDSFVYGMGWDVNTEVLLNPPDVNSKIKHVLGRASKRGVRVRFLLSYNAQTMDLPEASEHGILKPNSHDVVKNWWDPTNTAFKACEIIRKETSDEDSCVVDIRHGYKLRGSNHAKMWVVRQSGAPPTAFLGGIDVTQHRWDTTDHGFSRTDAQGGQEVCPPPPQASVCGSELQMEKVPMPGYSEEVCVCMRGYCWDEASARCRFSQEAETLVEKEHSEVAAPRRWHDAMYEIGGDAAWGLHDQYLDLFNDPVRPNMLEAHAKMLPRVGVEEREKNRDVKKGDLKVQLVRSASCLAAKGWESATVPRLFQSFAPYGEFTYAAAWFKTVANAKDYLFVICPLTWFDEALDALAEKLPSLSTGIVILTNRSTDSSVAVSGSDDYMATRQVNYLHKKAVAAYRKLDPALGRNQAAEKVRAKLRFFTFQGVPDRKYTNSVYVHEKGLFADDEFGVFGSACLERVAFTNDVDLGVAVHSPSWIKAHRTKMWAHMLALDRFGAVGAEQVLPLPSSVSNSIPKTAKAFQDFTVGEAFEKLKEVGDRNQTRFLNLPEKAGDGLWDSWTRNCGKFNPAKFNAPVFASDRLVSFSPTCIQAAAPGGFPWPWDTSEGVPGYIYDNIEVDGRCTNAGWGLVRRLPGAAPASVGGEGAQWNCARLGGEFCK